MRIGMLAIKDLSIPDGTSSRIIGLSNALQERESVSLFSIGEKPKDLREEIGFYDIRKIGNFPLSFIVSENSPPLIRKAIAEYYLSSDGWSRIRSADVDLLHCNHHLTASVASLLFSQSVIPRIFDMHGILQSELRIGNQPSFFRRFFDLLSIRGEKKLVTRYMNVSTPSDRMSDYISREFGIRRERVFTIPDGFDSDLFENLSLGRTSDEWNDIQSNHSKVVLYIGSISPLHDSLNLVRSIKQFNEKYPDMSTRTAFVIITSGINSRIKREFLDISHNLRNLYMLPSIPHELLPDYLASADLLLIPYSNDQFSMIVPHLKTYEYMASGTPIVAEYTQGSAGVLEDGRNCFIADADSPRRFAEKIEYSLTNENESRGIGKEARKQAFEKYSWKRTSEIAIEAYRRILE